MKHNLAKSMIALVLTGVVGAGPTSVFAALRPLELTVFPEERTIGPGETTTVVVSLIFNSETCGSESTEGEGGLSCLTGAELSVENVPPGITACIPAGDGSCSVDPVTVPLSSALVVLSANQSAGAPGTFLVEPGTYDLRVHAEGVGGMEASAGATLQLTVQPFSLSFPPVFKMGQGSTVTVPMSILRAQGFVTPVSLQGPLNQIGSPEDDITVQFSPNPIEGSSGSMSVITGGDLAQGAHTVQVKGTTQVDGVQLTRTKTLTVHVRSCLGGVLSCLGSL